MCLKDHGVFNDEAGELVKERQYNDSSLVGAARAEVGSW
jgi:hypothetical protein